jgi:hypothetical protein
MCANESSDVRAQIVEACDRRPAQGVSELMCTGGRVYGPSGAAAHLGIPRSTLESRIRALKIDKGRFRT